MRLRVAIKPDNSNGNWKHFHLGLTDPGTSRLYAYLRFRNNTFTYLLIYVYLSNTEQYVSVQCTFNSGSGVLRGKVTQMKKRGLTSQVGCVMILVRLGLGGPTACRLSCIGLLRMVSAIAWNCCCLEIVVIYSCVTDLDSNIVAFLPVSSIHICFPYFPHMNYIGLV